ncbi:MAG: class I SAM-dependent methyltransferase [Candidatus Odinarchaeota archaeon]
MNRIKHLQELIREGKIVKPKIPVHPIHNFIEKHRHQLQDLMLFLDRQSFFNEQDVVLEIGMGAGAFTSLISPRVRWVITCEISEEHVMEAVQTIDHFQLENVDLFWGTAEEFDHSGFKVKFPSNVFDKVVAQGSFRKPAEIKHFFAMAKRVRKVGGMILLSYNPYHFKTEEKKLSEHESLSRRIFLRRKEQPKRYFEELLNGLVIQAEHACYRKFPMPEQAHVELANHYDKREIDLIREKGHVYPVKTILLR